MTDILVSPFDNFFLFTIESQMNGMRVATDLSVYREAYLTFKDNENYAVRTKSSPLFGQDSARQGEVTFSVLSYDAKQARKIKTKTFLISVIRDYPDGAQDETVIFTGTWDLFELSAELEYNAATVGIEEKTQANVSRLQSLTSEKVILEAEIAVLETVISSKEIEKNSLETTLNANLAKLSSLQTSGLTNTGLALSDTASLPSDVAQEKGTKANVVVPITETEPSVIAALKRRGSLRRIMSTGDLTNINFK